MAAIDFPNSPSVNDQFTAAGKTWIWTGTSWDAVENNSGSVTSVGLTMPAIFSVSGSPVTGSGTLAVSLANAPLRHFFAGGTGAFPAAPAFRTIDAADLPAHNHIISDVSLLQTTLDGKEPVITAGTTSQYWRGDKSWQTLNTDAVTESSNLYFTEARVRATPLTGYVLGSNLAITATDTVLQAFQKIQGQLSTQTTIVDLGNLSGSVVVDLSLGSKFRFAQTGNITSFSFSNEVVGREYMFEITRETTNYTFTFATGKYRFPIGAAPIMTNPTTNGSSPAKAIDILSCLCMISGRLDLVITPDMLNN